MSPGAAGADARDTPGLAGVTRGELFAAFLKMGLLGFGGVMPWARRVMVDERRWLTDREFVETMGMCQVLPGPNVVNLSVVIGSRAQGPVGAVVSLTGMLFVPIVIALVIATFYSAVKDNPMARDAITAASAAAAGLVLGTAARLVFATRPAPRGILMGGAAFISIGILKWPFLWVLPVLIVVAIGLEWRAHR
jgi:chromate transporter